MSDEPTRALPPARPESELEFRQVGDTWLHVRHEGCGHSVMLAVVNERTQSTEYTELTTAMARLLLRWLQSHYPES